MVGESARRAAEHSRPAARAPHLNCIVTAQAREWFFDATTRRVFYWPEDGHDPNQLEIVAPRLNRILHFKGDVEAGTHVRHVILRGLEFRHTTDTLGHIEARVHTDAAVTFTLPVQAAGRHAVRLNFPAHTNRASNGRVVVEHAGGSVTEHMDQRSFGFGPLVPGKPARVTLSAATADGRIAIEGIGFARVSEPSKCEAPAAGADRSGQFR